MTARELRDHRHEATLEDTFDFLNTDELDGNGHRVEHVLALSDATGWLVERGLLYRDEARPLDGVGPNRAGQLLEHVLAARAGLREVVEALVAVRPADPRALATVNALLRSRTAVELRDSASTLAVGHVHVGAPLDDALSALAWPLVATVDGGDAARLRICANDGCRWVFRDGSRTGRRRWCSMASCGNRAKAARHRARHRARARAAPAPETTPPPRPDPGAGVVTRA